MSDLPSFEDIKDNLSFLDDWEDRYRYLIELGQALPALSAEERTDANKVHGCVSQVWLSIKETDGTASSMLTFAGDSDAMIVKGLVAVLIALYSGKTAEKVLKIDAVGTFDAMGLREHLTTQRSNGLVAMVERVRTEANARLKTL